MSIRSAVTMYFDNLVEPMFQRDEQGRELFFPMGLGSKGRIVPDAATSLRLRRALRLAYQILFLGVVPVASGLSVLAPWGALSIGLLIAGVVAAQLSFTSWLSRGLAVSDRRMNLTNQTAAIATSYSSGYIRLMVAISAVLTLGGVVAFFFPTGLLAQTGWGRPMALGSALFFAAMTVMWLRAGKIKARG